MDKNGCYKCTERRPHCHSDCERHKRWKEERDAKQAAIREAKDKEQEIASVSIAGKIKALKQRENWKVKER